MFIELEEVAKTLNIKLDSLFKVLNRCGYGRTFFLNVDDTKSFINCLENKQINKEHPNTLKLINVLNEKLESINKFVA